MANEFRGEVNIELKGVFYTLRPTFQAICSIEQRTRKTIADILKSAAEGKLFLRDIIIVLEYCLVEDKTVLDEKLFSDENLIKCCAEKIIILLMSALGIERKKHEEKKIEREKGKGQIDVPSFPSFDWHSMMVTAVRRFNIPSLQFWNMTMSEYRVIQQSYLNDLAKANVIEEPPTRWELREMMDKFPDKKPTSDNDD